MSNNQFKPFADATATLGTIHTKNEERDAVHLAVFQVTLGRDIPAYENTRAPYLTIKEDGLAYPVNNRNDAIGILDPFIDRIKQGLVIPMGSKVWLVLFPGMITSLRHVWEHPSFENINNSASVDNSSNEAEKEDIIDYPDKFAEKYPHINRLANELNLSHAEMVQAAKNYINKGTYYRGGDEAEGVYVDSDFWVDIESYTGLRNNGYNNFITCSC